ncbi:hypothetical protein IWX81_002922 [Salinibacterium sp. CAN_S4]
MNLVHNKGLTVRLALSCDDTCAEASGNQGACAGSARRIAGRGRHRCAGPNQRSARRRAG